MLTAFSFFRPMELVRLDEKAPSAFLRKVVGDLVREGAFKGVLEADRFVPEVYIRLRQAFLDSARTVFVDKYQARICLQYRGLSGIKDASLKSRLAADLLQFARENGIPAIEKLEMALLEDTSVDLQPLNDLRKVLRQTGAGSPMHCLRDVLDTFKHLEWHSAVEEGLPARKKATMEEINAQLQNSKDLSLALLSTLLLVLAATRDGVVKATGYDDFTKTPGIDGC